jgi:predicted Zn-dependent protease with MMP-like domain
VDKKMPYQVSRREFERLLAKAIDLLPPLFRQEMETIIVEVADQPTPRQLQEAGLDPDELLLGLYVGRPLTERTHADTGALPDRIYIFQDDVQQVCDSAQQLVEETRVTILHELGHHFGLGEDDLDKLGYG